MTDAGQIQLPPIDANHRYLLDWARRNLDPADKVLDYGCGDGALVFTARQAGLDAYGAETYYDGARPEDMALARALDPDGKYIHRIVDGRMATFPDGYFGAVISNQVFEHVHDIRGAAAELSRVLAPGGVLLSIFPTRSVVREPHLHVPLIHRLPNSALRRSYFSIARRLFPRARTINWGDGPAGVDKAVGFLENYVVYRTPRQLREVFEERFAVTFIEDDWLAYRAPWLRPIAAVPALRFLARLLARRAGGVVMLAVRKSGSRAQVLPGRAGSSNRAQQ